jgi:hypothetical protein
MDKRTVFSFFWAVLLVLVMFILISYLGFLIEGEYRKFIRYLYVVLSDGAIIFRNPGKYFHFPSPMFCYSLGLFYSVIISTYVVQKLWPTFKILLIHILLLTLVISLFSWIDSGMKIIQCTACIDGKRILVFNTVPYDLIFILALIISALPFIYTLIKKKRSHIH